MKEIYLRRPFQSSFKISSNSAYIIDFLHIHYGRYVYFDSYNADYNVKIIEKHGNFSGYYFFEVEEDSHLTKFPIEELLNYINANSIFDKNILALHGAAVAWNSSAYLFLAPTLRGKTTLTSYLCNRGLNYITDDCILVDRKNLDVYPYCTPMHLRKGGVDVLEKYGFSPVNLICIKTLTSERYIYTPSDCIMTPLKIMKIFFLSRTIDVNQIIEMGHCESMEELLQAPIKNYQLDWKYIQTIAELANIDCAKIEYSSMDFVYKMIIDS